MHMTVVGVCQYQIGAQALSDGAAIVQADGAAGLRVTSAAACGSVRLLRSSATSRNTASSKLAG
ncbi:hypothetical protein HA48_16445 [Pantoea wallisii]|uniref:Uncharacterized protein n=1 Tax=Pantoea wallisii TaxID=1076551 RepID=A0A1X1D3U4_9GAMM|nr:hypothetical protein HA48_16445 [Pantoea wallisii]